MFTICFEICFPGATHFELWKKEVIPFAPTPGMQFTLAKTDRGDMVTIGSKSGALLTYNMMTREFFLRETWNPHWIDYFKKLGFQEDKL